MRYTLSNVIALLVLVSITSSWLTATVVAQSPVEKAFNRTVSVTSGPGSCTGVILQTSLVLTAAHCIINEKSVKVGDKPATLAKIDKDVDLALLYAETIIIDRVLVSDVKVADDVFTWGFPMGSPNRVFSKGYVTVIQFGSTYSTNMAVGGQSGSGLFNTSGHLVGVITEHMDGTNFSVNRTPSEIRDFWRLL